MRSIFKPILPFIILIAAVGCTPREHVTTPHPEPAETTEPEFDLSQPEGFRAEIDTQIIYTHPPQHCTCVNLDPNYEKVLVLFETFAKEIDGEVTSSDPMKRTVIWEDKQNFRAYSAFYSEGGPAMGTTITTHRRDANTELENRLFTFLSKDLELRACSGRIQYCDIQTDGWGSSQED